MEAWKDAGPAARRCIIELARRAGLDSSNSSFPPSSDRPGHGRESEADDGEQSAGHGRKKKKRKSGGQPGHSRHERTLIPTEECDRVESFRPACCSCGCCLNDVPEDPKQHPPKRHQFFDFPEIKPVVVEYQRKRLKCPDCGRIVLARLPAGVPPGAFGPGVISIVTLLGGMCRLSQRLTAQVLTNLFGMTISTGMISKLRNFGQQALDSTHKDIAEKVQSSPAIHADETGWVEDNKKAWLWTAVAPLATLFLIRPQRNSAVARELIGAGFQGIVITDRFTSYHWIDKTMRQFCWAHLLRDFQAMIDIGGAAGAAGNRLKQNGQTLIHQWKKWKAGQTTRGTFDRHVARIRKEVQSALMDGLSCDHVKTEGVCCEVMKHFESLWTFVEHEHVEPTNNRAERSVRHGVIWRKLSNGTKSEAGSRYVETILSVIATCRQNAINPFEFVTKAVHAKFNKEPAPKLQFKNP